MKIHKILASIILIILIVNILYGILYRIKALNLQDSKEENLEINKVEDQYLNEMENDTNGKTTNNDIVDEINNNIDTNTVINAKSDEFENSIINDSNIEEEQTKDKTQNHPIMLFSEDSEKLGVTYRTHVQNVGWQELVKDSETAGTERKSLRLEGINIKLTGNKSNLKIKYRVHIQDIGWQNWKTDGEMAGTEGKSLRLEAIKIELQSTDNYSVMYRVHVQNIGWQDWKIDGEMAGTEGRSLRLEAIQIKIVPKVKKGMIYLDSATNGSVYYSPKSINVVGWKMSNVSNTKIEAYIDNDNKKIDDKFITYKKRNDVISAISGTGYGSAVENSNPGFEISVDSSKMSEGAHTIKIVLCTSGNEKIEQITTKIYIDRQLHVQYRTHVQNVGWQGYVKDGEMAGTSGKSYRVESLNISLINAPENAKILYRTHVQNIGWQNWQQNGEMAGTSGKSYRIEAIEIMLENMDKYTVEYQVHIQDKGWTDWYMDGETAGTVGQGRRIEAIRIRLVAKKEKRSYKGIDVSKFNGSVNWGFVKRDGIDFAFIRAGFRGYGSRGTLNEDPYFKLNMQGAKQAGIPVGVYFITQAITPQEAVQEANWVIERVKNYNIDYPIAIDIEAPGLENPNDIPRTQNLDKNTRTYLAKLFCQTIQKSGYIPIIYCNVDWAYNYLNMSELSEYDTWIASYRDNNPGYNGKYSIWQYTSRGQVNGVLGYVDRNICYKKY